jgi:hypothetical protein
MIYLIAAFTTSKIIKSVKLPVKASAASYGRRANAMPETQLLTESEGPLLVTRRGGLGGRVHCSGSAPLRVDLKTIEWRRFYGQNSRDPANVRNGILTGKSLAGNHVRRQRTHGGQRILTRFSFIGYDIFLKTVTNIAIF